MTSLLNTLVIDKNAEKSDEKKSKSGVTFQIDEAKQIVTAIFSHGKQLSIEAELLTDELQVRAKLHGLKQKLGDATAISRNTETGASATIEDKYNAMHVVYSRLLNGEWNAPKEGGGNTGGLFMAALARLFPNKSAEDLKEWIAKKSDAEKAALKINPRVVDIMDKIRAERLKADEINSDDLLGELE